MAQIRYNIKYKLEMKTKLSNKTKKELFFRVLCFLEKKKTFFFFLSQVYKSANAYNIPISLL